MIGAVMYELLSLVKLSRRSRRATVTLDTWSELGGNGGEAFRRREFGGAELGHS